MDEILNVSNEESTVTKKKPRGKGKLYDVPIVIYASEEEASLALRQPLAGTTWLQFNSDKTFRFTSASSVVHVRCDAKLVVGSKS